jgi:hypothetical protein
MKKRHHNALEKVFAAEIEGRLPLQSKARIYEELALLGYVKMDTETLGRDRFGTISVSGWYLTQLGRLAYCMEC